MTPPRLHSTADIVAAVKGLHEITGPQNCVILGTMALLPVLGDKDTWLRQSIDIDLVTAKGFVSPRQSNLFQRKLGLASEFEMEHGFYVHIVPPKYISDLPHGWKERAIQVPVGESAAYCLSPLDVAFNKLLAGRPKDFAYLEEMVKQGIVTMDSLREFAQLAAPGEKREQVLKNMDALALRIQAPSIMEDARQQYASKQISLEEASGKCLDCFSVSKQNEHKAFMDVFQFLRNPSVTATEVKEQILAAENQPHIQRGIRI